MDELAGTENRLAVERQRYNERVQGQHPAAVVPLEHHRRALFGFKEYTLFGPRRREGRSQVDFPRPSP
ncbi:MAG: LemA family protein [Vicinamibacterales bacterium]